MEFVYQIILVILLVFLNSFFVASEFSLVSIRKTRVKELIKNGNQAAKLIQKALDNIGTYISATQLGITLSSLALGWIGEPAIANFLEPFLNPFLSAETSFIAAHTVAVTLAFSLITFLHIVLGELAPKTIALQRAEKISLFIIVPLTAFTLVFRPFVWLLNRAGSLVLKIVGFKAPSGRQLVHSEEEIKMLLNQSSESGLIPQKEVEMVQNIFKLGDTNIKQIMVPRKEITAFESSTPLSEVLSKAKQNIHSRFPVFKDSIDNVVGFIHVKDIYQVVLGEAQHKKLEQLNIIRKIIFVPEDKKADRVLIEMRQKRVHIAIVKNQSEKTVGLVTLEDVVESVVGEIEDEFETD